MRPLLFPFRAEEGTHPVPIFLFGIFSEQPQGIGGKLLVGLLTDVSRWALKPACAYPPPSKLSHYDRQ